MKREYSWDTKKVMSMKARALRAGRKFTFVIGIFLIGTAVFVGGTKLREQLTFANTQATVLAVTITCEMSYKTGRWSQTARIAACADVPAITARYSEVEWQVRRIPIVSLSYPTADNGSANANMPLERLERGSVRVGEVIPVLQSPGRPGEITGPASIRFLAVCGTIFCFGLFFLGLAMLAHRGLGNLATGSRAPGSRTSRASGSPSAKPYRFSPTK